MSVSFIVNGFSTGSGRLVIFRLISALIDYDRGGRMLSWPICGVHQQVRLDVKVILRWDVFLLIPLLKVRLPWSEDIADIFCDNQVLLLVDFELILYLHLFCDSLLFFDIVELVRILVLLSDVCFLADKLLLIMIVKGFAPLNKLVQPDLNFLQEQELIICAFLLLTDLSFPNESGNCLLDLLDFFRLGLPLLQLVKKGDLLLALVASRACIPA